MGIEREWKICIFNYYEIGRNLKPFLNYLKVNFLIFIYLITFMFIANILTTNYLYAGVAMCNMIGPMEDMPDCTDPGCAGADCSVEGDTSAVCVECVEVAGIYVGTITSDETDCGFGIETTDITFEVTQDGCNITAVDPEGGTLKGTLSGNSVVLTGTIEEPNGTTTETCTVTFSSNGEVSGDCKFTFTFTEGGTCDGTEVFTVSAGAQTIIDDACEEKNCSDSLDNDGDGNVDCADANCAADPACIIEDCDNGIDDDGDEAIDCDDADCSMDPACVEPPLMCNPDFAGTFDGDTRFERMDAPFAEDENVVDPTTVSFNPPNGTDISGVFNAEWLPNVQVSGTCSGDGNFAMLEGSFGGACPGSIDVIVQLLPPNELTIIQGNGTDCKGDYTFDEVANFSQANANTANLVRLGTSGNISTGSSPTAGCGSLVRGQERNGLVSALILLLIPIAIFVRRFSRYIKRRHARALSIFLLVFTTILFSGLTSNSYAQTIIKDCSDVLGESNARSLDALCSELKSMEGNLTADQKIQLDICELVITGDCNAAAAEPITNIYNTILRLQGNRNLKTIQTRIQQVKNGNSTSTNLGLPSSLLVLNGAPSHEYDSIQNQHGILSESNNSSYLSDAVALNAPIELSLINQTPEGGTGFDRFGVFPEAVVLSMS